jgi:ABC-type cobalamin transport system permease subunit
MLKYKTRSKAIQVWFVAVVLVAAAGVTVGVSVTAGTAVTLLVLCLVPPAIILMLWPRNLTTTAGDVIRGVDRRVKK